LSGRSVQLSVAGEHDRPKQPHDDLERLELLGRRRFAVPQHVERGLRLRLAVGDVLRTDDRADLEHRVLDPVGAQRTRGAPEQGIEP